MTGHATLVPILRMFDEALTRGFYLDYLGAHPVFEHRFDPDSPLYLGVRVFGAEIHLSGHFGDATPGSGVRIELASGLKEYHETLRAKEYRYAKPGIQEQSWGWREMIVNDPAGNRLVFCEPIPGPA